ncbi:hypothetical protein INT43_000603 [Umbelopsis isabellina]|uniref:BRCT domain-containing protein n=1 Tax=Mortierella isabellina TaxID=91625 RepID=A0A8H7Q362_MORIS|nr:hypothetical protein INT43_000603 [Umbelopsis isabellina]
MQVRDFQVSCHWLAVFQKSRAQAKRQQRRKSLGRVASFVVMDKWLVKKPGLPNNKDQKQLEGEEKRNVFRFNDILYNSHLTGHQRRSTGGSGSATTWVHMREAKIKEQLPEKSSDIFKGVNIYINGTFIEWYTGDNKDLQLKQLVAQHGGSISYVLAQKKVTHIIVQSNLSGSKTHQYINLRKNLTKLVTSNWITDSIANGKRLSEWKYKVLKDQTQDDIYSHLHENPVKTQTVAVLLAISVVAELLAYYEPSKFA